MRVELLWSPFFIYFISSRGILFVDICFISYTVYFQKKQCCRIIRTRQDLEAKDVIYHAGRLFLLLHGLLL